MELGISGKRALVLGASQGLGRAVAEMLVREGCKVGLVSRNRERLEVARSAIGAHAVFECDLTQPGASAKDVQEAQKIFGGLDILVTNAGGPPKGSFTQLKHEQWIEGFNGLWMSAVDAISAALPSMIQQKWGRVVMITSLTAKEPSVPLTISSGFRAGLSGLCKSIAQEVAQHQVTLNAVLPGYTMTDRLKELGVDLQKVAQEIPAKRIGRPDELASLVAFLVSEPAAYITGQSILCDGGATKGL